MEPTSVLSTTCDSRVCVCMCACMCLLLFVDAPCPTNASTFQGNATHDCDDDKRQGCTSTAYHWSYGDTQIGPDGETEDDGCAMLEADGVKVGSGWLDLLPFSGFLGDSNDKDYTNQQLWDLFDPMNPRLTYLYDTFDWVCGR